MRLSIPAASDRGERCLERSDWRCRASRLLKTLILGQIRPWEEGSSRVSLDEGATVIFASCSTLALL